MLYLTEDPESTWLSRWSVDQAVWNFGQALEAALEKAAKNAKKEAQKEQARARVLQKWLPGTAGAPRYRDPSKEAPDGMARRV